MWNHNETGSNSNQYRRNIQNSYMYISHSILNWDNFNCFFSMNFLQTETELAQNWCAKPTSSGVLNSSIKRDMQIKYHLVKWDFQSFFYILFKEFLAIHIIYMHDSRPCDVDIDLIRVLLMVWLVYIAIIKWCVCWRIFVC